MVTKAQEIQHRIDQIADLLDRMREAHGEGRVGPSQATQDVIETEPARVAIDGPAHRRLVDPQRQYTDNMAISAYANPEVFGRNRDGAQVVVKSSESQGDFGRPPPQGSTGVGQGTGPQGSGPTPQALTGDESALPPWEKHGVTGKTVAAALSFIDQARDAANNPITTGAVDELGRGGADKGTSSVPTEQQYFDAAAAKGTAPDMTNPSFAYVEGATAHDEWVQQHTPGLQVEAGAGKEIDDGKYGVTVTMAQPRKTKA
ncbi:MAG: hypothetical protein HY903_22350 [Deltaproteobacteria bacterium]|nr:hypothetical protein [Deltaproteobacteria bacterium]